MASSSHSNTDAREKLLIFQKAQEEGKEVKEEEKEGYTGLREIIVLAIKLFGLCTNSNTNISTIALIATLYLRTSTTPLIPTSVISFGTADPDTNTVNYIINQMGVPPGSFTGVGRPDPINNNNNFSSCNAPNLPDYQMNIPGPELFNGVPAYLLPAEFAAGFNLDLWDIQNEIKDELRI
ncbi:hypothetical protein C1646_673096 [Rhizophagus diaphanus]|nr:hypothetical protein C1646_673096 [Rhizophagus diaphanus] [Rhizophagus sp. MUCL 43196]